MGILLRLESIYSRCRWSNSCQRLIIRLIENYYLRIRRLSMILVLRGCHSVGRQLIARCWIGSLRSRTMGLILKRCETCFLNIQRWCMLTLILRIRSHLWIVWIWACSSLRLPRLTSHFQCWEHMRASWVFHHWPTLESMLGVRSVYSSSRSFKLKAIIKNWIGCRNGWRF